MKPEGFLDRTMRVEILFAITLLDQGNPDRREEAIKKLEEAVKRLKEKNK